jgi:hypothetical protein
LNANDLVTVDVLGTIFNQRIITTFPYVVSQASLTNDTITACKAIADYWQSGAVSPFLSFLACCPQNYTADWIRVQRVYPTRNRSYSSPVNLPGTDANDATTANSAASIERAAALAGRKYVGRISIPALAPFNQVDGMVLAAFKVKMGTVASKMLNVYAPTTGDGMLQITPCLIHRVKTGTPPHWVITGASQLYTAIPQDTVRTQRSRNIGKGI